MWQDKSPLTFSSETPAEFNGPAMAAFIAQEDVADYSENPAPRFFEKAVPGAVVTRRAGFDPHTFVASLPDGGFTYLSGWAYNFDLWFYWRKKQIGSVPRAEVVAYLQKYASRH